MKISLKKRAAAAISIFTLVVTCSFVLVQAHHQRSILTRFNAKQAGLMMLMLQEVLDKPNRQFTHDNIREELQPALVALIEPGSIRSAYVYSADGIILASTQNLLVGTQASPPELLSIKNTSAKALHKNILDKDIDKRTRTLSLYYPIKASDGTVLIARLDTPLGSMKEALQQAYIPSILTSLIVFAASILLWVALSRRVLGPISLLNTAAKEIAAGDLNLKIHINTKDELEEISATFNLVAAKLKKAQQKR
jgi:nitrogen fixation/metabolism regulation signal transduction histidine kinase